MFDQLDRMQVTCSPAPSYAIGPLDPAHLVTTHACLSDGRQCPLLTPTHFPLSILHDPAFRDGYEWNVATEEEADLEAEDTWTIPQLLNHVSSSLTDHRFFRDPDTDEVQPDGLPWQLGWLLRDLTRLAETDHTLALVGMAHLCFLLPLLTEKRPANWPRSRAYEVDIEHRHAVKAYRAVVRRYREQGKSFEEAQRLALTNREGSVASW